MLNQSLRSKIAVVTGASRGLGRATTLKLSELGATVILHYGRSKTALEELQQQIQQAGGQAHCIQGDLAQEENVVDFLERLEALLERLSKIM